MKKDHLHRTGLVSAQSFKMCGGITGFSVVLSNTAHGIFSLGRGNLLLPQLRCSKKLGLWRPGPTQNAHPDVLGLLWCPCSLCGVTLQGHQEKKAIKAAAAGPFQSWVWTWL